MKALKKAKTQAEKAAEAKKAEENRAKILDAIEQSGKSFEEIIDLLK